MLFKRLLHSCLLIGITAGSLYAGGGNPYANHYPYNTINPPYWVDIVIPGDAYGCFDNYELILNVVQRNAMISEFNAQDNYGYNRVALPYNGPVWVDGISNDQGGTGCTVSPGQTLQFTGTVSSGTDPGHGTYTLETCLLHCP